MHPVLVACVASSIRDQKNDDKNNDVEFVMNRRTDRQTSYERRLQY
jgi:hypothetical protein